MFKKSCLVLIILFLLFVCTNCNNNSIFESMEENNTITVSLVVPDAKGSIDVTDYQIVEVEITITAPDATQESQTWVPGDDVHLIFQNKGNGLYTIAVRESDEVNHVATYDTDFTVTDGHNVLLTVHLGGNG